jgi:S-DNA-T family DNA segregation ATPase FtsK/SpoIIIE
MAKTKTQRRFDVWYKTLAILLFLFSGLVLLSLLSYSPEDEAVAFISFDEIMMLLGGDPIMADRAASVSNLLGIAGAVISHFLYNDTIGYAILLLPVYIGWWAVYLFTGKSTPSSLYRRTAVYLLIGIFAASFFGTISRFESIENFPKEWCGSVGFYFSGLVTGLLGKIGGLFLFPVLIVITLLTMTNLNIAGLIEKLINRSEKTANAAYSRAKETYSKMKETDSDEEPENNDIEDKQPTEKDNVAAEPKVSPGPQKVKPQEKAPEEINSDEAVSGSGHDFDEDEYSGPASISSKLNISFNKPKILKNKSIPQSKNLHAQDDEKEAEPETTLNNDENTEIEKPLEDKREIVTNQFDEEEEAGKIDLGIENVKDEDDDVFSNFDIDLDDDEEDETEPDDESKPLHVTVKRAEKHNDDDYEESPDSPLGTLIHDMEIDYESPDISLLDQNEEGIKVNDAELTANAKILQEKLETFKIMIEDLSITPGPVVTQYEFVPAAGIKLSKIEGLSDDLAMALKARGIRIIAPIPGKGTVGVEIPNATPSMVRFSETVNSAEFRNSKAKLPLALGKDIAGEVYTVDLAKMPHLLIAGSTGSGKSVGINVIINSLIYKKHPSELKFIIIDPKKVELQQYNKLKKHFIAVSPDINEPIITKPEDAVIVLKSAVKEMEERYDILAMVGQRNISDYNKKVREGKYVNDERMAHRPMPYIVVIIDELADLMLTASKEIEEPITRLAQMARAVGIHLVVATQRPSVDVITGLIKANFPARMAYLVSSKIDSRTILDMQGAEKLLGQGDMLCLPPGSPKPVRIQNAFIDTDEVDNVCDFIGKQRGYDEPYYLPTLTESKSGGDAIAAEDRDPLFEEAARLIIRHQQGSVSLIQRRLKVGYARAGRIVDELEAAGIVGPFDGSKARLVLMESESELERVL